MKFEKVLIGAHQFKVGDLVLNEKKDEAYIITRTTPCTCCCHCDRLKRIRAIYVLTQESKKWDEEDFPVGKREVMRAVK